MRRDPQNINLVLRQQRQMGIRDRDANSRIPKKAKQLNVANFARLMGEHTQRTTPQTVAGTTRTVQKNDCQEFVGKRIPQEFGFRSVDSQN